MSRLFNALLYNNKVFPVLPILSYYCVVVADQLAKGMTMIQLLPHEIREWNRCACALYARGMLDGANLLANLAAKKIMPIRHYDAAAAIYRAWLVFDEPKARA